jgi:hypothetical protein
LPSIDELQQLYRQRSAIGGFADSLYWSSSDVSTEAFYQNFGSGDLNLYYKNSFAYVRPVRAF